MRAFRSGDEAVLDPTRFSLEGRGDPEGAPVGRPARARRLSRFGSLLLMTSSEAERADVDAVTREWLAGAVDRGFSMAMDDLHTHSRARFALATDGDGSVRGYLHLVPSSRGYSLSAMRRGQRDAQRPHGVPDRPDDALGFAGGRRGDLAQLRGASRTCCGPTTPRRSGCGLRGPSSCGSTGSSSSSGSSASAASSTHRGAPATSASSVPSTCPC